MPNKYFDSLSDRGTTEGVLSDKRYDSFITDEINNLPAIPVNDTDRSLHERAGFVPDKNNPGNMVTPSRRLVEHYDQKESERQQRLQQEYQDTKNSTLFKVGDTLADAGRLFLSPLFWLSGEDTTKYDPSAMVDAGYKQKMRESEDLRVGMYRKLLDARDNRLAKVEILNTNRVTRAKSLFDMSTPSGTNQKALRDFAAANGLLKLYNDRTPESQQELQNMLDVQQQKAFPINDGTNRILPTALFTKFDDVGTRFKTLAEGTAEAYGNYSRMMTALSGNYGGIGDIAAIFSFMKSLDPRSVVRDSEFKVAANAGGVWENMKNLEKAYAKGEVLPEKVREQMRGYATDLMKTYAKSYERYRKDAIGNMEMLGYGDERMVNNFLGEGLKIPEFKQATPFFPPVVTNDVPQVLPKDVPPLLARPGLVPEVTTDVSGGQAGTFNFTQLDDISLNDRIMQLEAK